MNAVRGPGGVIRRGALLMALSLGLITGVVGPATFAVAAPPAPTLPGPVLPGQVPAHGSANGNGHGGGFGFKFITDKPQPRWPASNTPLHITAPTLQIYGLSKVVVNDPVRQANGQMSPPDTYYLKVRKLELDDVKITSEHADHTWLLANLNGGKANKSTTLTIGNDARNTTVDLWVQISSLKLCITPETLYTIINSEKGQLGGRLDEVFDLITTVFQPYREGPLRNVGPCIPIKELLALVGVLLDAGIPLPELPAIKMDLTASAVQVNTTTDQPSVRGPLAIVRMFQ